MRDAKENRAKNMPQKSSSRNFTSRKTDHRKEGLLALILAVKVNPDVTKGDQRIIRSEFIFKSYITYARYLELSPPPLEDCPSLDE